MRDAPVSGVPPLVEEALEDVRSSPFESACCFVSTFEEDHLEKRGVVGREEAGDEHSDVEVDAFLRRNEGSRGLLFIL